MKTLSTLLPLWLCFIVAGAQQYPEPEFANEVYLLRKSDSVTVVRLEKDYSSLDTKVSMGGLGGAESGYQIEGEKSTVRVENGKKLSFVYSTGASAGESSPQRDSAMRAHGVDPAMYSGGFESFDPNSMITLYKSDISKGKRKIYLQKGGGYFTTKLKSSQKFSFSVRRIRDGYWELVIDKTLPKGEYVFSTVPIGMGSMDGSAALFAFGIDE